jgi:hypothetical protein
LVPFGQQTWPPRLILFSDWLIFPWRPYLLVERNEMEKLYRGPYCQVWFHLAKLLQRRRLKYEKVNGRTTDAHMVKLHVFGNNSKTINNIRNLISTAQQDLTTLQF